MFRANMINISRAALRMARVAAPRTTTPMFNVVAITARRNGAGMRPISSTAPRNIAILPGDAKKPEPKEPTKTAELTPTEITEAQYHKLADEYLEAILGTFEELQDAREDVDVEYSVRTPATPQPYL